MEKLCSSYNNENDSQEFVLKISTEIANLSNILDLSVGIENVVSMIENQSTPLTNDELVTFKK